MKRVVSPSQTVRRATTASASRVARSARGASAWRSGGSAWLGETWRSRRTWKRMKVEGEAESPRKQVQEGVVGKECKPCLSVPPRPPQTMSDEVAYKASMPKSDECQLHFTTFSFFFFFLLCV